MDELKTLIFDIETSPMVAYVWERRDVNIALNQLKAESFVMAWSAKWLNASASSIVYQDQRRAKDVSNDKAILGPLWKLLDEADIVITQNGKNFDSLRLNARFIMHGMTPPSAYRHLDTYQIARKVAKFTSNKLEYLTDKLCTKYKKLSHGRFPGMELWKECLAGNAEAWDEMRKYNINDVLSTEELYNKLRAWVPQTMPTVFFNGNPEKECNTCGVSGRMIKQGTRLTKTARYQNWQCKACASWQQGEKV